jgi:hypothetical protein
VQGYWLPSIRASIEISARNAAGAIQVLESTLPLELSQSQPFELGMLYPIYLRGQSHLLAHRGKEAAAEFQKIINRRGIVLNFPLGALARLGLAPRLRRARRFRESSHRLPGFHYVLERRRSRHPHPEAGRGGGCETTVNRGPDALP